VAVRKELDRVGELHGGEERKEKRRENRAKGEDHSRTVIDAL
jgi:hypothetical protein